MEQQGFEQHTQSPQIVEPGQPLAVPVVAEQLRIDKHAKETAQVVVHVEPQTRVQTVDVPLVHEEVQIERVPINRQVDAPTPPRQEGDVTVVPVFEEILVVQKKLVLKEEIRISRRRSVQHDSRQVALRTEQARVLRSKKPD